MKKDQISNLYTQLTSKEKASLAFNYALQNDKGEVAKIMSTLGRQTYYGVPIEYHETYKKLYLLAFSYAIDYWRLVAHIQTATIVVSVAMDQNPCEFDEVNKFVQKQNKFDSMLDALEIALDEICDQHGIDP